MFIFCRGKFESVDITVAGSLPLQLTLLNLAVLGCLNFNVNVFVMRIKYPG